MDHHPFCPWWKVKVKVAQSCPTLFNPMVYIYTVHGIHQARILELVPFPFSMGSSQPRDRSQGSCIVGGFFTSWATREARQWWSHYLKIILCLSGCKTPSPNYSGDLLSLHHTLLKKKKKRKKQRCELFLLHLEIFFPSSEKQAFLLLCAPRLYDSTVCPSLEPFSPPPSVCITNFLWGIFYQQFLRNSCSHNYFFLFTARIQS